MIDFPRDNGGNGDDWPDDFDSEVTRNPITGRYSDWDLSPEEMQQLGELRKIAIKLNCFDGKHLELLQSLGFGTFGEKRDKILEAMSSAIKDENPLMWENQSVPEMLLTLNLSIANSPIMEFYIASLFNSLKDVDICEVTIEKILELEYVAVTLTFSFSLKPESKIVNHEDYRTVVGGGSREIRLMGQVYFIEEDMNPTIIANRLIEVIDAGKLKEISYAGNFTVYKIILNDEMGKPKEFSFVDIGAQIIDGAKCRVIQFVPTKNP